MQIAFVRQSFLDAQHQQLEKQKYEKTKTGVTRPAYDPSLDAIQPALARALPVAFEADLSREIRRALNMAKAFNLDPVPTSRFASSAPVRRRRRLRQPSKTVPSCSRSRRATWNSRGISCATPRAPSRTG